jgi:hypothetical protein
MRRRPVQNNDDDEDSFARMVNSDPSSIRLTATTSEVIRG